MTKGIVKKTVGGQQPYNRLIIEVFKEILGEFANGKEEKEYEL